MVTDATGIQCGGAGSNINRVLVAGAMGYIGRYVARELCRRGYAVLALARPAPGRTQESLSADFPGCEVILAGSDDPDALKRSLQGEAVDAVVSCMASRNGAPDDAWRVDFNANRYLVEEQPACR